MNSILRRRLTQFSIATLLTLGVVSASLEAEQSSLIPPSHLIAWWTGDDTAMDHTGISDGQLIGDVTYAPGIVGQAFDFSGGYVSMPDHPALRLSTSYTIEMWINPRDLSNRPVFFSKSSATLNRLGFEVFETGRLCGYFDNAGCVISDTDVVMTGVWSHVALVFDDFANEQRLYLNGHLVQVLFEPRTPLGNFADLSIGRSGLFPQFGFNGLIDEVSVYGRALDSVEILDIYTAGSSGKCKDIFPGPPCELVPEGIVAWWPGEGGLSDEVNSFDAIGVGTSFVPSLIGSGIRLNGGSDRIEVAHAPELGLDSSFTFECWVAPDSVSNGPAIFEKGVDVNHRFGFQIGTSGLLCAYFDGGFCAAASDQGTITPGIFSHVAVVFDDTAGRIRLYKNGILVGEASDNRSPSLNASAPLVIGNSQIVPTISFSGIMDEISLYDRPLGGDELLGIFLAGSQGKCFERNLAPVASAGSNQVIRAGTSIVLDGSGSTDDRTATENLQFAWTVESSPHGNFASLSDADSISPTLVTNLPGLYVIDLVVTDEEGLSSGPDSIIIDTTNLAPVANAGTDLVVPVGENFLFDGSLSSDPEGDALTYQWTLDSTPTGSIAMLEGGLTESPSILPDLEGFYEVRLEVGDSIGFGESDLVVIEAISKPDFAAILILGAIEAIWSLERDQVTTRGHAIVLVQLLRQSLRAVEDQNASKAIQRIQTVIIRTDGCARRGEPDSRGSNRDWILDCSRQVPIYEGLLLAIEYLR